jgi:hypothetical protein
MWQAERPKKGIHMINTISSSVANESTPVVRFTIDFVNHKIVGTEYNFRKASIPGTEQYNELLTRMAAHPGFGYQMVKPEKEKKTYKGLSRELMYDYLSVMGEDDMLAQLVQMKQDKVAYPTIKSWFLDKFPNFNVNKAKKHIDSVNLKSVKKKYRVIKANAKVSTISLPKAANE